MTYELPHLYALESEAIDLREGEAAILKFLQARLEKKAA